MEWCDEEGNVYNRSDSSQWDVILGKCAHGFDVVEHHDRDETPGFRCHDVWVTCECPKCRDKPEVAKE